MLKAVEVMKSRKAPGLDGVETEWVTRGGVTVPEWLLNLFYESSVGPTV